MKNVIFLLAILISFVAHSQVLKLEVVSNYIVVTDTITGVQYASDVAKVDLRYQLTSTATADSMRIRILDKSNSVVVPKPGSNESWWDFSNNSLVNSANAAFTRASLLAFLRANSGG